MSAERHTADLDAVAAVLAEHVRGDWSDRTYSCLGCRNRYEAAVETGETSLDRAELYRHIKPDWSIDDYNQHVAEHIVTRVIPPEVGLS